MSANVYCPLHRRVEHLTGRDVEDLIHALAAQWADEATDPTGIHTDQAGWALAAEFCPTEDLSTFRDPEFYAEHLEAMRDCRLSHQRHH